MTTAVAKKSEELREKAATALQEARKTKDKADSEERNLTGEEQQKVNRALADYDGYMAQARLEERSEAAESDEREERGRRLPETVEDPEATPEEREAVERSATPEYREAFYRYCRGGQEALTLDDSRMLMEVRALTEGTDSDGGYLAPPQLVAGIEREQSDLEQLAPRMRTINTTARAIQQVKGMDTVTFQWVTETQPKPEDQPSYARTQINANTLAVIVRVSDELLEDTTYDLEGDLSLLAAEARVEGEEASFVAGSGAGQPWGVLTRLNGETGTPNRYTTQAAGTLAADDFVRSLYALRPRHRRRASWVLGTQAILAARLLKESGTSNQYIWQPGLQAGQPDAILGKPVFEAVHDALDSPIATGNDIGFVGDLRRYTVLRRLQMQVKRLEELYAATDEVGFRFRARTGGDVQNTAAFRSIRVG